MRIVDTSGRVASVPCTSTQQQLPLDKAMDRLVKPGGLDWRRLNDGTLEIVATSLSSTLKLPALNVEGEPVVEIDRPANPVATPLVERAMASTSLDQHWLDTAPILGFDQISWYAPNVYGTGQSLAIRGTERDGDYFPALTVTFDGIDLGTRLLDDELVPLNDVTSLTLARGPRTFESSAGSQAGTITLQTAVPAAEQTTSVALGVGNVGARNGQIAWSGPLGTSGLGMTVALDEHELPSFVRQLVVPQATVDKRRNEFGRLKLRYTPESLSGLTAELAAIALSGDSSERAVVAEGQGPGPSSTPPPFDPFQRNSYALEPIVASTRARGTAGFVRYDNPSSWSVDARASITTIFRDNTVLPNDVQWTDRELRRRMSLTLSDHPAPDWTLVSAFEHSHFDVSSFTLFPPPTGPLLLHFATRTDSASLWLEHSWDSAWNAGLGVRWVYERDSSYPNEQYWYGYRLPIPLAVLEWRPWKDHVVSLSYGTGYRSGGQSSQTIDRPPEFSQNLEFAWRAHWFGDTLRTTLSAFDNKIRDRYTYFYSGFNSDPVSGHVRDRGVEFEIEGDITDAWRVRAGFGSLSSHYSSFDYRYDEPTSDAPPQTATFGVRYGLSQGWYGAADAYRAAGANYDISGVYRGRLPPYDVLSVRIGYRSAIWEAALTLANALDTQFIERVEGSANAQNPLGYRLGDPRRIELRVKWTW